jgi:hypothetical protein
MKKKGNMLIEVVASIMILLLTTTFIISTSIQNNNILRERILLEEVNRDICNLKNEFKYNMTRDEIEEILGHDKIKLKYDKNFSRKLLDNDIKDLEVGHDIEITKIGEDSIGLKIKIEANIKIEEREINVSNEFTKSWWMDEI